MILSLLISSIQIEGSIVFLKIFGFQFLIDLHIFGSPKHDLTLTGKYLSAYICVCLWQKNLASVAQALIQA